MSPEVDLQLKNTELRIRLEYLEGLIDFLYDHLPNLEDLESLYEEQQENV